MDLTLFARALAAVLALPLGGLGARLSIGAALGSMLALLRPAPPPTAGALLAAIGGGLLLGVVAGLPVRVLGAIGGRPGFGRYGRAAGWALFFASGGPVLWAGALALEAAGGAWFTAALLLGLPVWIVEAGLAPVMGWLERVGPRGARRIWPARGPLVLIALLLWLPALLGWLDPLWQAALGG
ncbi:MAG: hypothetical protein H6701_06555 [Myxococcales bacterium]|nr:hypothetical protein [Myxococcales bacterium]